MATLSSGLLALVACLGQVDSASPSLDLSPGLPSLLPALSGQAPAAGAQDQKRIELSLGLGGLFGGEARLSSGGSHVDVDTEPGFMGKVTADYFLNQYFGFGGFFTGGTMELDDTSQDVGRIEVGLSAKGRFSFNISNFPFMITPGLGLGYRWLMIEDARDSNGMAVNFGVDFRVRLEQLDVFLEPGFVTQPVGGNEDFNVTFGPIPYFLVGVGFRI